MESNLKLVRCSLPITFRTLGSFTRSVLWAHCTHSLSPKWSKFGGNKLVSLPTISLINNNNSKEKKKKATTTAQSSFRNFVSPTARYHLFLILRTRPEKTIMWPTVKRSHSFGYHKSRDTQCCNLLQHCIVLANVEYCQQKTSIEHFLDVSSTCHVPQLNLCASVIFIGPSLAYNSC